MGWLRHWGLFFSGAMIGFSGLRPKPRYGYGAAFLRATNKDDEEAKRIRAYSAAGFQITNTIRQNEAFTAIKLIQWGVIAFTIALVSSCFAQAERPIAPTPAIISPPGALPEVLDTAGAAHLHGLKYCP
jgi:hypothetical protein